MADTVNYAGPHGRCQYCRQSCGQIVHIVDIRVDGATIDRAEFCSKAHARLYVQILAAMGAAAEELAQQHVQLRGPQP